MNNTAIINPRQGEYFDYLQDHISNVNRTWVEFLEEPFGKLFPDYYSDAVIAIALHDNSKYQDDEFDAYCNYFYPCENFEADDEAFDYAWLLHQKRNPHHWQYWVLIRDSGESVCMDMTPHEIANMLCDWHGFSAKDPHSTAYNWYYENKDNMMLSENTQEIVEILLEYLQEPLR